MASPKYAGSPTGSGNPPGKYSENYLNDPGNNEGHFVGKSSYRGDMHVKINDTATDVGNQPKNSSTSNVEAYAKKPALR